MGLEPTTASLEGWRSAIELRPQLLHDYNSKYRKRTSGFDRFFQAEKPHRRASYRAGRYDPVEALQNWGGGEDQHSPPGAAPLQRLSIAGVVQTGMRKDRGIDRTTYRSTNHRTNRN